MQKYKLKERTRALSNAVPCAYAMPYDLLDELFFLEEIIKTHVYYSCDEFLSTGECNYPRWFVKVLGEPSFIINCNYKEIKNSDKLKNTIIRLAWDFGDFFIVCRGGYRDKNTLTNGFSILVLSNYVDSPKVMSFLIKAVLIIVSSEKQYKDVKKIALNS